MLIPKKVYFVNEIQHNPDRNSFFFFIATSHISQNIGNQIQLQLRILYIYEKEDALWIEGEEIRNLFFGTKIDGSKNDCTRHSKLQPLCLTYHESKLTRSPGAETKNGHK